MSDIDTEETAVTSAQRIAELSGTVRQWSSEEATAHGEASAARHRLETAQLSDAAGAYELMQQIEDAEHRATAAAAVAASARRQLDEARSAAAAEDAAELRAAADRLWAQWRAHQTRTVELLRQLREHEGVDFHPPGDAVTEASRLLEAAKVGDAESMAAQLHVAGEFAVIRSGPAAGGERAAWIAVASSDDGRRGYRPPFTLTVDDERRESISPSPFDGLQWVRRHFPADAVLAVAGRAVTFTDEPPTAHPGGMPR